MKHFITSTLLATGLLLGSSNLSFSADPVQYNNLPEKVRSALGERADGSDIQRIRRATIDGTTYYQVKLKSGENNYLYVTEAGKIVDGPKLFGSHRNFDRLDRQVSSGGLLQRQTGQTTQHEGTVGFSRPLAATSKMSFDELPGAVKNTVRDRAGSAAIEDVERGTLDGRTVYEVAFKKDGVHNELRVWEDGSVLNQIAGHDIRFPGQLRVSEVPQPVQNTIRERLSTAEINDIDRKTIEGRTIYEVGFKRPGDTTQYELQITEDGTVIREASGAELQNQ